MCVPPLAELAGSDDEVIVQGAFEALGAMTVASQAIRTEAMEVLDVHLVAPMNRRRTRMRACETLREIGVVAPGFRGTVVEVLARGLQIPEEQPITRGVRGVQKTCALALGDVGACSCSDPVRWAAISALEGALQQNASMEVCGEAAGSPSCLSAAFSTESSPA